MARSRYQILAPIAPFGVEVQCVQDAVCTFVCLVKSHTISGLVKTTVGVEKRVCLFFGLKERKELELQDNVPLEIKPQ